MNLASFKYLTVSEETGDGVNAVSGLMDWREVPLFGRPTHFMAETSVY